MINNTDFRQFITRSIVGEIFISAQFAVNLWQVAYTSPEQLGMLANDEISRLLVTRICQPNKTFVDVGAHIGSIISSAIRHDSSIKIIAIEPVPEKAAKLKKIFPFAEIYSCAVGNEEGKTSFFINTKQSGFSSLIKPSNLTSLLIKEIQISIKKLDELIKLNNIDVIKIDVEGAELEVLKGSKKILKKARPTILFESGAINLNETDRKKELWRFLTELNFQITIPNRVAHNDRKGLSQEGFIESHIYPRRTTNYFAIPNERRLEIRDTARKVLKVKKK